MESCKDPCSDYKDTLNLPQTNFPMRANLPEREPELLKRWEQNKIYKKLLNKNKGRPKFILHDGPPYANGNIHFGHILNKTLKDIIVKYKNLSGYQSEFVPGWDCHGLPVEHQVDKELKEKGGSLDILSVRKACRSFAKKFVDLQREQFKRLGIFGSWDRPYLTMDYSYEAVIAGELAKLVRKGMIYKGAKPVHWCIHCQTALAEAEVEYEDHLSPSIFVKFVSDSDLGTLSPALAGKKVNFVIWTTTPWTLPANLALAVHRNYMYVAIELEEEIYVVAEGLLDTLRKQLNFQEDRILDRIPAKNLEGILTKHPFLDRSSPLVLSDHVTLEAGTGIVHIAPGHGQEDYEVGQHYQLPSLNPVDHQGNYTSEVGIPEWEGLSVFKANPFILQNLKDSGALWKAEEMTHSYPHCWRCKNPVIFRSTPQYFISLSTEDLRGKSLDAIRRTLWVPEWGRDRIYGMVESRSDWCISRQRAWGVPLMAFRCLSCQESILDGKIMDHLAKLFSKEGTDAYFRYSEAELLPKGYLCPHCQGTKFEKENDILDVWFDSGVSYAAVLEASKDLKFPADLYLEGSDQHRGWFHSSLLEAMATRGQPPYETVLTHGFVVDGEGKKYSKSGKNYTDPEDIINSLGADILRLWVSAEDYRIDIRYSEEILSRIQEAYRKIRNTARFMLGNLFDFDPEKDTVPLAQRSELDRWAVAKTHQTLWEIHKSYENYEFHMVYQLLTHFFTVDLSSFYLDILKDRLYVTGADSSLRRASQSTLNEILNLVLPYMAPILSFTSEEIFLSLPGKSLKRDSIFLQEMHLEELTKSEADLLEKFEKILKIRNEVLRALEKARKRKIIRHSLEAQVRLSAEDELKDFLQNESLTFWQQCFIVSQVVVVFEMEKPVLVSENLPTLKVDVLKAEGEKCERCWNYSITVGKHDKLSGLCDRCIKIINPD